MQKAFDTGGVSHSFGRLLQTHMQNHLLMKKNVRRQIDKVLNYVTHKCRGEYRILDNKSVVKLKFLLVKDSQVKFSCNLAA